MSGATGTRARAETQALLSICFPPPDKQEKEESGVITREELKHQSQLMVESKSKKKPWKNDKF